MAEIRIRNLDDNLKVELMVLASECGLSLNELCCKLLGSFVSEKEKESVELLLQLHKFTHLYEEES